MPKKWKVEAIFDSTGISGRHELLCWHAFRDANRRRRTGWCLVWCHASNTGNWYLSGIVGRSTEKGPDWHWCAMAYVGTTPNDHSRQIQMYSTAPTNKDVQDFLRAQCPGVPPTQDVLKQITDYRCGTNASAWVRALGEMPFDLFVQRADCVREMS